VSGIQTGTRSQSNSYTDARLRAVMPEVGADFVNMAGAGIIEFATATRWSEDLLFVLQHQAARGFQIQLNCPGRVPIALDYRVSSDGSVRESSTAGGINYYALPAGTTATLFVDLNFEARQIATVQHYTRQRGWGTGLAVAGDVIRDRVYSKDGYGVIRGKVGDWP
jgi:lipid-binding SYLF domain-containing protein